MLLAALLAPLVTKGGTFTHNFNTDPSAQVFLLEPAKWEPAGGVNNSGYISLTDALGSQNNGSIVFPDIDGGAVIGGFSATFKLRIGGGSARPADGFSFNFGSSITESSAAGEEGTGDGIIISFDTWDNAGTDTAPAIDVKVGGTGQDRIIATIPVAGQREGGRPPAGPIFKHPTTGADFDMRTGANFEDVRIEWRDGLLTLNYKGVDVIKGLPVLLEPMAGRFSMGARTGGATDNHWIDDVRIETFPPSTVPTVTSFSGTPFGVNITISDSATQVNQSSIKLKFDGADVTPNISKAGKITTLRYSAASLLASGSSHDVNLVFADTGTPPVSKSVDLKFVVTPYKLIPSALAYPITSADTSKSGFKARIVQANIDSGALPNDSARAEAQLAGTIIDPITGKPYLNDAVPGPNADKTYNVNVINFDQDAGDNGNFTTINPPQNPRPDGLIPGIPGAGGHTDNISGEFITFLELKAGHYRLGVNSDDGFLVTTGPDGRDALGATALGVFEGGRGAADTIFDVVAQADGIYPVRLLWYEGLGGANVEFFSVTAAGEKVLINDTANPNAIKAWREITAPTRPYVSFVGPRPGSRGVKINANVEVRITDGTIQVPTSSVRLSFNGSAVNAQVNKAGGITTITYDPPGDMAGSSTNTVQLVFSDSATPPNTRTNSFSFVTERPPSTRPAYQQDSAGLVVIEAENFHGITVAPDGHFWSFENSRAGFSGDGYMQSLPDSGINRNVYPDFLELSPRLSYKVNFNRAGTHFVWIRGGDPVAGGGGDSIHAGINGDSPDTAIRIDGSPGLNTTGWNWVGNIQGNTRASINVPSAGEHTVMIFMREDGNLFDKLILASAEAFAPTGTGPAESIRVGQGPPPTVSIGSPAAGAKFPAGVTATIEATATASAGHTIAKVEFFAGTQKLGEDTSSPYSVSVPNAPTGRYVLTAKATDSQGLSTTSAAVTVVVGNVPDLVLLVVANGGANDSDNAIRARLQGLGFEVKVVGALDSKTSDAEGTVLVIASSTIPSGDVGTKFRNAAVPVITWEQALQDDMLMTTNEDGVTRGTVAAQTQINIVNANHALAAGLPAGRRTVSATSDYSWGVPGPGATIIATLADDPTRAVIYAYDTGANLVDGTTKAPARRLYFLMTDGTFNGLNDDGKKLFDAALSYALNRTLGAQAKLSAPVRQGNNLTLTWTGGGTLQSADAVTGPWADVANAASPHTATISGSGKFYRIKQ